MTTNKEIPMVKSLMDYLGRWLALKFLDKDKAKQFHNGELVDMAYDTGTKSSDAFAMRLPVIDEGASSFAPQTGATEDKEVSVIGEVLEDRTHHDVAEAVAQVETAPSKIEQAKAQGYTGSICTGCGSVRMKRNGSCEVCLDCGATSGCS